SFLEKNVADKYFLSEKMRDYVMSEGTGNFKQKPEINLKVARPLTASMHKNHRAGTDNYYSEDRVIPGKTNIRRLTPREAARLQG
ncbi:DNA cytosine methyltransferase, partial [Salmonella enterica]|uniref:DNA cytosine methyltransferase n=1 Tax=Salmonella enterica TaxID=28901 RepID=UPI0020C1C92E